MRRLLGLLCASLALAAAPLNAAESPVVGVSELFPVEPGINAQRAFAVAVAGDWLAMGARLDDETGEDAGAVFLFHWSGTAWEQTEKVVVGPPKAQFGFALAMRGRVLAVSAPGEDAVYVFKESEGHWMQSVRLSGPEPAMVRRFGRSLALGDDQLAVAAVDGPGDDGAVFLYSVSSWSLEAKVQANVEQPGERFGAAVSLAGEVLAVGAPGHDSEAGMDSGAIFVFKRLAGVWRQTVRLDARDSGNSLPWDLSGDQFGFAVATDGTEIFVGAPAAGATGDRSGAVYRFARNGSVWMGRGLLEAANIGEGDQLGFSLAMSGDLLAVGAPAPPQTAEPRVEKTGGVRVFRRNDGVWREVAPPKNAEIRDLAGFALAVDNERVVIGGVLGDQGSGAAGASWSFHCPPDLDVSSCSEEAEAVARDRDTGMRVGAAVSLTEMTDDDGPSSAFLAVGATPDDETFGGAVYVYRRAGTGWRQEARMAPFLPSGGYGSSVAITGNSPAGLLLAVGSPKGRSAPAVSALDFPYGVVDLYVREQAAWRLLASIGSPAPGPQEKFGTSVAFDNGVLVVGAPRDHQPGAVYVFEQRSEGWTLTAALTGGSADDGFGSAVSVKGSVLAIGAPGAQSNTGAVYVAERGPSGWSGPQRLPRFQEPLAQGQRMGASVAAGTGVIAVGAPDFLGGNGAVYLFGESDGWQAMQALIAGPNRRFGTSVALQGPRLLVGAKGQNPVQGQDSDHAFLFEPQSGGLWVQVADLDAVQAPVGDEFGTAVALSKSFCVVTSPGPVRSPRVTVFELRPPQPERGEP